MESRFNFNLKYFFIFFISICAYYISSTSFFSPIDDHLLLNSTSIGKFLPLNIAISSARFFPLTAQEFNLISLLSSEPIAFYLFNGLQFLAFCLIVWRFFKSFEKSEAWVMLATLFIIFTPGFISAYMRFFVGEKGMIFLLAIILLLYSYLDKGKKAYSLLISIFFLSNVLLYIKETAFILIGGFAFFNLVISGYKVEKRTRLLNVLILASSIVYLLTYYYVVYSHRDSLYGSGMRLSFLKNLFAYVLNDSFLFLMATPLCMYRIFLFFFKKEKLHPIFDSLLISTFFFILGLLTLNIYSERYLLPAYIFAIPAVLFFRSFCYNRNKKAVIFLSLISLILVVSNQLPFTLHLISHYKVVPKNYNMMIKSLSSEIKKRNTPPVGLFLAGCNKNLQLELFMSLKMFLKSTGVDDKNYRILDNENELNTGDIVVVMAPFTLPDIDLSILPKYKKNHELIYSTSSDFYIPNFSLKNMIKTILLSRNTNRSSYIMGSNTSKNPNFYLFRY